MEKPSRVRNNTSSMGPRKKASPDLLRNPSLQHRNLGTWKKKAYTANGGGVFDTFGSVGYRFLPFCPKNVYL